MATTRPYRELPPKKWYQSQHDYEQLKLARELASEKWILEEGKELAEARQPIRIEQGFNRYGQFENGDTIDAYNSGVYLPDTANYNKAYKLYMKSRRETPNHLETPEGLNISPSTPKHKEAKPGRYRGTVIDVIPNGTRTPDNNNTIWGRRRTVEQRDYYLNKPLFGKQNELIAISKARQRCKVCNSLLDEKKIQMLIKREERETKVREELKERQDRKMEVMKKKSYDEGFKTGKTEGYKLGYEHSLRRDGYNEKEAKKLAIASFKVLKASKHIQLANDSYDRYVEEDQNLRGHELGILDQHRNKSLDDIAAAKKVYKKVRKLRKKREANSQAANSTIVQLPPHADPQKNNIPIQLPEEQKPRSIRRNPPKGGRRRRRGK